MKAGLNMLDKLILEMIQEQRADDARSAISYLDLSDIDFRIEATDMIITHVICNTTFPRDCHVTSDVVDANGAYVSVFIVDSDTGDPIIMLTKQYDFFRLTENYGQILFAMENIQRDLLKAFNDRLPLIDTYLDLKKKILFSC